MFNVCISMNVNLNALRIRLIRKVITNIATMKRIEKCKVFSYIIHNFREKVKKIEVNEPANKQSIEAFLARNADNPRKITIISKILNRGSETITAYVQKSDKKFPKFPIQLEMQFSQLMRIENSLKKLLNGIFFLITFFSCKLMFFNFL